MIEFNNISKIYPGNKVAVKDINMSFDSGEFVVFIGTSGSGKTTCMRMINRMINPTSGEILIDGKNIMDMNEVDLRRQIGYVIQQVGLMPHMTVYENIVMVPKLLKWDKDKQREIAERLIKRVDLPVSFLDRYPQELSGGQQQRIGVIRALAADQKIILMDEPFGALDPITRASLQKLIKKLQKEMGKTIVFVTHDMDEALSLADKIAILDKGRLVQFDTPDGILANPKNEFVEKLVGEERLNEARSSYQSVKDIMFKNIISAREDMTVHEAIKIMSKNRVDMLFIVDEQDVLHGLVDIFDLERVGRKNIKVQEIMKDADYILDSASVRDAIYSITNLGYKNLPVVDSDSKLVGLVTRAAVVDAIYENLWGSDENFKFDEDLLQTTDDE
ncbi:MAG: ABC transporter ATP-binding protein [Tissierellia bacterium]|nr:ABC transporter ATP-binding protein [Tissierellia bacterium]